MTVLQTIAVATVLFASGVWLLLPRGRPQGRKLGVVLTAVALSLFGSLAVTIDRGSLVAEGVFLVLAATTVISALGAVAMRSPVYCAIWFALTLLGTAGLFLFQGAQFLGVATVVVYAGAILVTFLFVLMLAQPKGLTHYDRVSWEGLLSACTGALLVGMLSAALFSPGQTHLGRPAGLPQSIVRDDARHAEVLHSEHMAHLGRLLFSRHLIAVEVAGTLLLASLVGAVAIVAQGKQASNWREEPRHG